MEHNLNNQVEKTDTIFKSDQPKHKQLIKMLTFRVVPAYYKEIEKVANAKKVTVSKLIRTYIKDGLRNDGELSDADEKEFMV